MLIRIYYSVKEFITLTFVLFSVCSSAQTTTFRRSYDIASFDLAGGMVETPSGDFLIAGTNASFVPLYGNLIYLDSSGVIQWSKRYSSGFATTFNDLKNIPSGGFIIAGQSDGNGAILIKVDNSGNVIWSKRYALPNFSSSKQSTEYFNAVIPTSDGGFVAAGGVDYFWDGVSASTVDTSSCFAVKVDANGVLQWSRVWTISVTNPDEHYLQDVTETADGFIFVGISSEGSGTLNSDGDYPRNGLIIKTDKTTGATTYINRFGAGNSSSQGLNCAITLSSGSVLIAGYDDVHAPYARIAGTGASFTQQAGRRINGSSFPVKNYVVNDIAENSDGNYSFISTYLAGLIPIPTSAILKINSGTNAIMIDRSYGTTGGLATILPEGGVANDQGYFYAMTDQQTTGFNYQIIRTDNAGLINVTGSNCTPGTTNASTNSYTFTAQSVTNNQFANPASESSFTPTVSNLSPTNVLHCLNVACSNPPAPTTVTASPSTICQGQSTSITASGGGSGNTYQVYASASGGTSLGSTPYLASPSGTTTYYVETVSGSNPSCKSTTRTPVTVNVDTLPTVTIGGNSPVCLGNSINLTATGGGTYSWTGPSGFSSTSQNPTITNAQLSYSGYYVVNVTNGACSKKDSVEINVTNGLVPGVSISSNPNGSVCAGSNITFTASPTNGGSSPTYSWFVNGNFVSTGSASFSSTSLTNNDQVSLTMISSETCVTTSTANSNTITVSVNPQLTPSVNITSDPSVAVCAGTSFTFNANPTNGGSNPTFQWYLNGNPVGSGGFTYTNSSLSNGDVISVELTSDEACASPATVTSNTITVSINPTLVPDVSLSVDVTGTQCAGAPFVFTAIPTNGGSSPSYQWLVNGSPIVGTGPSISLTNLNDNDVVSVVLTSSESCANPTLDTSNSIVVSVAPNVVPAVSISVNPTGAQCEGTAFNFTATPSNEGSNPQYSWYVNGVLQSGNNSTSFSSTTLNNNDVVTVSLTNGDNCVNPPTVTSNAITVQVNSLVTPSVTINANPVGPICSGTPVSFTATPVNGGTTPSYQWFLNGNPVGTNSPTYSNSGLTTNDVVSVVLTSNANCLSSPTASSNNVSITVNNNLTPSVSLAVSPNTPVCAGSTLTFSATPTNGGSSPTYSWLVNGTPIAQTGPTFSSNSLNNGDQVTVVLTSSESCVTTPTANSNVVNVQINPSPAPVITGNNSICVGQSTTLSTTQTFNTYSWSNSGSTPTITVSPSANTIYTVVVTDGSGCSGTATYGVTVNPLPIIVISGPSTVCASESVTLTASGGTIYSWSNGATGSSITISPTVPTTYSVTVTDVNGCSNTDLTSIGILSKPTASITGNSQMCKGRDYSLTASGGGTYSWNTGDTSASITVNTTVNTNYTVVVSNGSCSDTAVQTVTALDLPTVSAGNDVVINQIETATLTASGGGTYSWFPSAGLDCINCSTVVAKPESSTTYCVLVTGTNGCTDTACVNVKIEIKCGEVFVPTIFSPNDDNLNDVLCVLGNCIDSFNFSIFDRWGEKVFETNDQKVCWDGTYQGKLMNTATFVYILTATLKDGTQINQQGNFTLVR